jgi:hypothetical protein
LPWADAHRYLHDVVSRAWPGVMLAWLASCSSTGKLAPPSVIGEWRSDAGAQFMFFDADGTCGEGGVAVGGQAFCLPGTYRYENGALYVTLLENSTTNIPVKLESDTLTVTGVNDEQIVYTRENSLPANHCP